MNKFIRLAVFAVLIAVLCPALAAAQYGDDEVNGKVAGTIGGAIIGGELIVGVEALIGVKPLWPYLTFPLIGAAGGGVGGYFLGKTSPEAAVGTLIGGVALLLPTILVASAARAYDPDDEGAIDEEAEGKTKFSFELTPDGKAEEEATTTEVESRPEGAPAEALPPPGTSDAAGELPPKPEPEAEAEPEAEPEPEPEPEGEETTSEDDSSAKRSSEIERTERSARIRRATAGSLFYVDNDGSAAIAMPFVDVRPAYISMRNSAYKDKQAIEVYIPLLRIDLP